MGAPIPSCCDGLSRAEVARGARRAASPREWDPRMPAPAGVGVDRRRFLLGAAGGLVSVYGAGRLGIGGQVLSEGIAAGAVVDGDLVALACTTAQTERHADVGIVTMEAWRGQGMATACAALVADGIRQSGRISVWSTGEDNRASLRVARKLGFGEVGRRMYLVPSRRDTVG